MFVYVLIILMTISMFALYLYQMKKTKINTKIITFIGLFSAISYILNLIVIIPYINDGGITLVSSLPIMLLGVMFGKGVGMTGGLILGMIRLLNGAAILHPLQVMLDYVLSNMVMGLAGTFGNDKKYKILLGGLFVTVLSTSMCVLSGGFFFGQFAPEGMNPWVYSIIYNVSSLDVEGIITSCIMALMPINRLMKIAKINNKEEVKNSKLA